MKRHLMGLVLGASLAGCGGTAPFGNGTTTDTDGDSTTSPIPESLAGNLQSFTYNAEAQTITIEGVSSDNNAVNGAYRRRPAMDRNGYEAYTAQNASNGRHSTVFVREINGTRAAVVGAGGQYENTLGGAAYSNTTYSPRVAPGSTDPDSGLVYYTGRYVGLLNGPGSDEDLAPTNPGENPSVLSVQAAEVTGDAQITADFSTTTVEGVIYNRVIPDFNANGMLDPNSATPLQVDDIALEGAKINSDGTFVGTAEQDNAGVGTYGGIFGGVGATEVAGAVNASNHIAGADNAIEYGVFVLGECTPPQSGPDCNLSPSARSR